MAARYGHQYRLTYGRGPTRAKYSVAQSELLNLLAVAALSGVVGGLAHDAVKTAIRKIQALCHKRKCDRGWGPRNAHDIEIFIANISQFHHGMQEVPEELRREIENEMFIDAYANALANLCLRLGRVPSEREMLRVLRAAHRSVTSLQRPVKHDFAGFWMNLDVRRRTGLKKSHKRPCPHQV